MTFRELYLHYDDPRTVWLHPERADDGSVIVDITIKPSSPLMINVSDTESDTLRIFLNKEDLFYSVCSSSIDY